MQTYTKSEMLALWRRSLGLETANNSCTIEAVEGLDVDNIITRYMRLWYLDLLDNAPAHLCPVTNAARQASVSLQDMLGLIVLPKGVRRVLSVKLSSWLRQIEVRDAEDAAWRIARLPSPFGRPGINDPLAIITPQGLQVFPATNNDSIETLMVIADPGEELYILDEVLLSHIPRCLPHELMLSRDDGNCL